MLGTGVNFSLPFLSLFGGGGAEFIVTRMLSFDSEMIASDSHTSDMSLNSEMKSSRWQTYQIDDVDGHVKVLGLYNVQQSDTGNGSMGGTLPGGIDLVRGSHDGSNLVYSEVGENCSV